MARLDVYDLSAAILIVEIGHERELSTATTHGQ